MIHYLSLQQRRHADGGQNADWLHTLTTRLAPLEQALPGLLSHRISLVFDRTHRQESMPAADIPVDSVVQLGFADYTALQKALASEAFQRRREVLQQVAARATGLVVLTNEVIARPTPAQGAALLKRMGLSQLKEEVAPATFRRWWAEQHGPRAAKMPELKGYVQNAVIDARDELEPEREQPAMRCDAVTELWFDDHEGMERAFPHRTATTVTAHAANLTARIATVLVEEIDLR